MPEAHTDCGILVPAYYVPIFAMLGGRVLRGIAFAFREQGGPFARVWSVAFSAGSLVPAFCQGLILGAFMVGHAQPH